MRKELDVLEGPGEPPGGDAVRLPPLDGPVEKGDGAPIGGKKARDEVEEGRFADVGEPMSARREG